MTTFFFIAGLLLTILSFGVDMGQSGAVGLRTYSGIGCMAVSILVSRLRSR